jgi:hypothetical protein
MELLLDGFKDNVEDEAWAAEESFGFANPTLETAGSVSQCRLHLLEGVDMALSYPGEVGEMAVALDNEINEAALFGGIKDFIEGQEAIGPLVDNVANLKGETGECCEFHTTIGVS